MSDVRDLTRASKDFSRGVRAREPDEFLSFRLSEKPPSLIRPLLFLFLIIVAGPSLLRFAHLALFVSPQYESTSSFVVRGEVELGSAAKLGGRLGKISDVLATTRTQEAGMLVRLIPDQAFVARLSSEIDLAALYSRDGIDMSSRFPKNAPLSALARYWRGMANISVDTVGGIATLTVRAFTPEDARLINETSVRVSEDILNGILESSRSDALRIAEQDRQRANEDLNAVRAEIELFRRNKNMLDPQSQGASALQLILERRTQRTRAVTELQAALAYLSPQSAQVRALRARIAALDEQIAALEAELAEGGGRDTIAALIGAYEDLELKRALAEQQYTLAEMTLLRTKAEVERWHIYLVPTIPPTTPIAGTEPRPFGEAGHVFLIALVIWGIVSLLVLGTAEHRQ
jgi:capsular polysaccharide transport system permease protein